MDQRVRRAVHLGIILLHLSPSASAESPNAGRLLGQAEAAYRAGNTQEALQTLRSIRNTHPGSSEAEASLRLSSEICLSTGDMLRARYFVSLLMSAFPASAGIFPAAVSIADKSYADNDHLNALEYYRIAVTNARRDSLAPAAGELSHALLRAAELCLYREGDREEARAYFGRVNAPHVRAADAALFGTLSKRLSWDMLSGASLGLGDDNVSAIRSDGDDVWIGTWNGGVARFSAASGGIVSFPLTAALARSVEIAQRRVWVGTADGLWWYSKATARWESVEEFRSPEALKVQALAALGDELYAGTLGSGLFRLRDGAWERVEKGGLPGGFITSLCADPGGERLFIGTMTMGLLVYDRRTGAMESPGGAGPGLNSANVTSILRDSKGRTWVGTYGGGLYLIPPDPGPVRHYTRASGEIPDDWVLCACETPRGLYFGTFGGGIAVLDPQSGLWRRIGIGDGLPSLDITAIAAVGSSLFIGTLGAGVCRYYEGGGDGAQL